MAAILGVSTYKTPFEYWHERKGNYTPVFEDNERAKWGNRLESAIAFGMAEDLGLKVEPYKVFIETDKGVASSFDFKILENPDRPREVGLFETLMIAIKGSHHARPGEFNAEISANSITLNDCAIFIYQQRTHTKERQCR